VTVTTSAPVWAGVVCVTVLPGSNQGSDSSSASSAALDKLQRHLLKQARSSGRSWTGIGESLGTSKQSAWQRFTQPSD
jgi:hypothetical protein